MAVDQNQVRQGVCFITTTDQMRRVVNINNGQVTYESWSAKQPKPQNPHRNTSSLENFVSVVSEEVSCDFDRGIDDTKKRQI
jgi:hypothetical protein